MPTQVPGLDEVPLQKALREEQQVDALSIGTTSEVFNARQRRIDIADEFWCLARTDA